MTQTLITYLLAGGVAVIVVLSFIIGLDKMIKIILGNYILGTLSVAISTSIDLAINTMGETGLAKFLADGKLTIIFVVYVVLLFLIYRTSKINVDISGDQIMQKSLYILFVPMAVLSIVLTLEIIFLGIDILDPIKLIEIAKGFTNNIYLQKFILNTPYLILVHALVTVLITSKFKVALKIEDTDTEL
ncbi:MAG TPA: hypothetical protein PKX34_02905 [Candidatus Absconditabacterales bacterium]|nr:hypothetical protein [Candidatus Absconditabacterales bacterium]HPK28136.1 hypothetical protein [Candidatus Absconditabacterales bacterium]